ncbi:hypothetical protein CHUAL_009907 [Chamberlinius hualienensis]
MGKVSKLCLLYPTISITTYLLRQVDYHITYGQYLNNGVVSLDHPYYQDVLFHIIIAQPFILALHFPILATDIFVVAKINYQFELTLHHLLNIGKHLTIAN